MNWNNTSTASELLWASG